MVFSLRDYDALHAMVLPDNPPELNVSLDLLYHLMVQIGKQPQLHTKAYALVKSATAGNSNAVLAFAKLNIVADGGKTHRSKKYVNKPSVAQRAAFAATLDYQQHSEVLEVLSEYNSRDELLSKYLTLYHVFENFMCKLPIVEMQTRPPGKQISIRDFYSLSKKLDADEIELLQRFFKKVFAEKVDGATEFSKEVLDRWTAYVNNVGGAEVDKVLSTLNIKSDDGSGGPLKHSEMKQQNVDRKLANIIYQLRNAIVHNKEVDLHITCVSISAPMERLISDVVVPSLERLCFHLIGTKNGHVWYDSPNLLLHK